MSDVKKQVDKIVSTVTKRIKKEKNKDKKAKWEILKAEFDKLKNQL